MVAALLAGCASSGQEVAPVLQDERAEAELAALFEDAPEQAGPAPGELPASLADEQPADVIESAIDEAVDPLDQIAANAPEPVLPTPGEPSTIRVFDWEIIDGAPWGNVFTGVAQQQFVRPVAIAVRSEYLYVVDAGSDALYRYDLASRRIEQLLDLRTEVTGEVADLYVDKDFSFYLTDTEAARVLYFDRHGRLLQVFRNHFNLARPVAVTKLESGDVVVADAHYDHLLRFNSMGKLVAAYGGRGDAVGEFLNITAMGIGPDGFYVGARVGNRLQVLGYNGDYLYSFEEGGVVFPAAIVVDGENRSYVADHMDNTIKVFDRGGLIGTIGRFGTGMGQFKRIADLWLDGSLLYIVDSLNARIQVARLALEPASPAALPRLPDALQDSNEAGP